MSDCKRLQLYLTVNDVRGTTNRVASDCWFAGDFSPVEHVQITDVDRSAVGDDDNDDVTRRAAT